METKILISVLISAVLLVSIGIVMAHGTDRNSNRTEMMNERGMSMNMNGMHDMGNMNEEMEEMMGDEMYEMMEETWNNETLRGEMSEHMKSCPMMRN